MLLVMCVSRVITASKDVGALDGSHIPASVPVEEQAPFRNRKGFLSQNVLLVTNFDRVLTYIHAGWEGSAHDGKVLSDAVMKGLRIVPGKFSGRCGISSEAVADYSLQRCSIPSKRMARWEPSSADQRGTV